MYETFFGLSEKPFSLTPNPRYVFASHQYREAESQLLYGINNREGFMLVTGQPGSGKTTLCRDILEKLDRNKVHSALLFNPFLSPHEMLGTLLNDFGVTVPPQASRKDLLDRLNQFLLAQIVLGKSCVAIFDEAQHLSTELLEQIRVLSNLETDSEKLLQIILVGQPELLDKIRTPSMAQLDQRVSIRCKLSFLSEQETDRYVHHRMNVAGARGRVRFDKKALTEIHRASTGVPRLINLVADRTLLAAYAAQSRDVALDHVRKAVQALRGEEPEIGAAASKPVTSRSAPRWRVATLATVALVLAVVGVMSYWPAGSAEQQAEALYWRGALPSSAADGEKAFRELVERFPASPRIPQALIGLAQYQQAHGDRVGALQIYQQIIDRFPQDSARPRALVLAAIVQLDSGDTVSACRSIESANSAAVADKFLLSRMEQIAAICPAADPAVSTEKQPDASR